MVNKRFVALCCGFILLCGGIVLAPQVQSGFPPAAVASETDLEKVVEVVGSYADRQRDDDPLIEVEPGIWAKQSNVKGVEIDGVTYYYNLSPHMSYDPVSRNAVRKRDITIVYEDGDTEVPMVIYKLRNP